MKQDYIHYFNDYMQVLKQEINAYPDDESLWVVAGGITNSGGTLCYHLLGNLNHFIGFALGNTGYVRDRPLEFTIRGLSRQELTKMIDDTLEVVVSTLDTLDDFSLPYPEGLFGTGGSIGFYMIKWITHFNYHLGQINYHRRLLT